MGESMAMMVDYMVYYYDSEIEETCKYKKDGFTQIATNGEDIYAAARKTLEAEEARWKKRGAGFSIGDVRYRKPYIINDGIAEGKSNG